MDKKQLAVIIGLIFSNLTFGQQNERYSELIKDAWKAYQSQEYHNSGKIYAQAFSTLKNQSEMSDKEMSDRFNAACAWSLAKEVDFSFTQLFKIAKDGNYSNYQQLTDDKDLNYISSDQRWIELSEIVKANYEKVRPLTKEELNTLFDNYIKAEERVKTTSDLNEFYIKFYTDDFIYNHPKYGGEYSRKLLFTNSLKYLNSGTYKDQPKRSIINTIVGLNAIVVERQYLDSSETTMTLFKFRKNKIYYIEEYW